MPYQFNKNTYERSLGMVVAGLDDPSASPTWGQKGMLYIRCGEQGGAIYQKQDTGISQNWTLANPMQLASMVGLMLLSFNNLLKKLDLDDGVEETDYEATLKVTEEGD